MPRHGGVGREQLLGREGHREEKQRGGQKCGPVRKEVVAGGGGGARCKERAHAQDMGEPEGRTPVTVREGRRGEQG